MTVIDKLAWVEVKGGKILSTRSKGRSVYYIPGGKREAGETDFAALHREIKEELDVELEERVSYLGTFQAQADGHLAGVEVKMTCYTGGYTGTLKPSSEIEEISWLTYADRHRVSAVDKQIFDWLLKEKLLR